MRPQAPATVRKAPEYGMITSIHVGSGKSDVTLLRADSYITTGHEVAEIIPLMHIPRNDI